MGFIFRQFFLERTLGFCLLLKWTGYSVFFGNSLEFWVEWEEFSGILVMGGERILLALSFPVLSVVWQGALSKEKAQRAEVWDMKFWVEVGDVAPSCVKNTEREKRWWFTLCAPAGGKIHPGPTGISVFVLREKVWAHRGVLWPPLVQEGTHRWKTMGEGCFPSGSSAGGAPGPSCPGTLWNE